MARPAGIHYLRPNHVERSPHRLLVVDTETAPISEAHPERQSLRLWCATLTRRHDCEPSKPRVERYRYHTADELADLIGTLARSDSALWVACHNLNFDLAVTELPVRLTARGWRITEAALTTDDPWFRASLGSRRVTVVDSWSYLPASVDQLGAILSCPKAKMPPYSAPDAEWWPYCERDVEIVTRGMIQLMDWWDAGGFGNWSLTGPATGWSSYRHRKPTPRVLVDPDPAAREFEAAAITGGRRYVQRVGKMPAGLYADLDMTTAHLTVMQAERLPCRRIRHFESMAVDDPHLTAAWLDVMAECELVTTSPRYPWRSPSGVFYPVGRFRTVLAGPELREAARRGELASIGPGYIYATSRHMQEWAGWIASILSPDSTETPPAVRLAAKSWSRAVPGKWDGHTSEVIERRPDARPGWLAEHGFIHTGHRKADFLLVGGERWTIARDLWSDDAFPAVLAWIQSYTRVALGRLIDTLGPAVLSANTDGAIVDVDAVPAGSTPYQPERTAATADRLRWLDWRMDELSDVTAPFTLRIKSAFGRLEILSPQHLVTGRVRHFAGVPARARRDRRGRFVFTSWPKLHVQIERPHGPTYATRQRTVRVDHVPPAGWLYVDGRVAPVRLDWPFAVIPGHWSGTGWLWDGRELAPAIYQHPLLRPLLATEPAQDGPRRAVAS